MKTPAPHRNAPLASALLAVLPVLSVHAATLNTSLTLTTDYVWRGSTQTAGDPAVQGSLKATGESGWYASLWASNVEFAPALRASSEFDFTLGWAGALSDDWAIDLNLLHYRYPSTTANLNWSELNGTLTFRSRYWAALGWSNEALGADASGTYALIGGRFPLDDAFRVEGVLGHYALDDLNGDVDDDDYSHAALSAVWAFKAPCEARLTWHTTDRGAETFFGDEFAGDRIEFALQASI